MKIPRKDNFDVSRGAAFTRRRAKRPTADLLRMSNHIGEIDIRNAIDRHGAGLHDVQAHEHMLIDIANSGHTWVGSGY
jgi:hypothetical protein